METQATTIYFPKNLHREIKIPAASSGVLKAKQGTAASGGVLNRSFAIKKISEQEERSFNKQVITLLKKALEVQKSLIQKGE